MQFFIDINNEDEFKKLVGFMSKELYGVDGREFDLMWELCPEIIDDVFYSDDGCEVSWVENFPSELFGRYYVHIENTFDRWSDISIRTMLKIEEPKHTVDSLIKRRNELKALKNSSCEKDRLIQFR